MSVQAEGRTGADLNAALSNALAGVQAQHLDHGPQSAIAFHHGNVVVAVMHDVLTQAETVLASNGNGPDVQEARGMFRREMEADFREAVERLTGRQVVAVLGDSHLRPDVAAEIFILDRAVGGGLTNGLRTPV